MENIKEIISKVQILKDWSWCVNKERFMSYAKAKYPLTNREAESLWKVWDHIIGLDSYRLQDVSDEKMGLVASIAREAYEAVHNSAHIHWHENLPKSPKWRVYYRQGEDGEVQQMDINLLESEDVIKYALLLQQEDIEIRYRLDFYETVETSYGTERTKIDVYDGDIIFCTDTDRWCFSDESGAYVCTGGCYKKLMYTPGRGYIRRGELDFEQNKDGNDCRYRNYVFNSYDRKFKVVGNIYVDNSVLSEKKEESK
jgi:hypothetical protein